MAYTYESKIIKKDGSSPSAFELVVAQHVFDVEQGVEEIQAAMRELYITSARQVDVGGGRSAVVIFVPYTLNAKFRKVQSRLTRELEKKMSGSHVVFVAQRKILPPETKNNKVKRQQRPRSRTLTAVHDAILEDVCFPTEIVGKRMRVKLDGKKIYKVYLDAKDEKTIEHKLDTYTKVYRKLTGKQVQFMFPEVERL